MVTSPTIPVMPLGDWLQKIAQNRKGRLGPVRASLEFTERCNYRCVHCYINQPAGDTALRQQELTLAEWQGILDQMERAGVLWLLVTGGEPLLRPDFPEFYLYAIHKGLHVTLFTNGSLITPDIADLLAANPPWEMEITLYGATAETYEAVTGIPGSYERCIRGIELLLERKIALNLKTMALTLSVHEIPAMKAMAEHWGVRFRWDPNVHARLNHHDGPLKYRLSPEAIAELERTDAKRMQQWQEYCDKPWGKPDPEALFTCGAASRTFHVDPYGGLYPCMMVRWLRHDLRESTLEEALTGFLPEVRRLQLDHNRTCRECDVRIPCAICPGWAYVHSGDPEAPDPFRCATARLRQQTLESVFDGISPSLS